MAFITCPLREAGSISRDQPAVIGREHEILYGELDLMASACQRNLLEAGIEQGDRVALYLEDGLHAIALLFALFRIGAIACPINTTLPVRDVRERLKSIACVKLIARTGEESRRVLKGIRIHDPGELVPEKIPLPFSQEELKIPVEQPATIVFTPGRAGKPKAVLHTIKNHYYSAFGANINVRVRSGDRWLLSRPLYHVGGMGILFRCFSSGATVVLMETGRALEDMMETHRVTHLTLEPDQLIHLLEKNLSEKTRSRLKAVMLGGGTLTDPVWHRARADHWPIIPTYGLTEMNSQVTAMPATAPMDKRNTAGSLLKYRRLLLAEDGEIMVKGETLFKGYVDGPDLFLPVDAEGWFATGDIGRMDEDGYLTVDGRKDNPLAT